MQALLRLTAPIDRLNRFVGRAMVWPLLAAVLLAAGNALARKFLGLSSNFWLEVQWHLFAISFLGSAGYVLLVDEHVRVDALARRWSARTRARLDVLALAFVALPLTLLFAVPGWGLFAQAWRTVEASFNAGGPQRWLVLLCIPLGMALLGLQAVSELVRRVAFLRGQVDRPTLGEADLPPMPGLRANARR